MKVDLEGKVALVTRAHRPGYCGRAGRQRRARRICGHRWRDGAAIRGALAGGLGLRMDVTNEAEMEAALAEIR